jgi:tRNA threonylcarbamoyladenosine biosynthesis protein TsaB
MRILGFDTATRATAVALVDTETGAAIERRDDPPAGERPRHTTRLMTLITEVLSAGDAGWDDVGRIAVGVGPGTFTGLRIGVATARALAQAREIDLVGVSTLHSLARGAVGQAADQEAILAVLDARRSEVFAAGWPAARVREAGAEPLLAPRAQAPDELARASALLGRAWLAVGDGSVEFRAVLERSGARIPEDNSAMHRVTAVEHCRLAAELHPQPRDGVRPEYLRLPDAELSLRTSREQ